VARRSCQGCRENPVTETRQLRIYTPKKQYQFRLLLCATCFGGLFDLIQSSADGFTEGLWNPIGIESRKGQ
jgi:hypothetical protein